MLRLKKVKTLYSRICMISGDGNHSSANVYGVVLYSTDAAEKQVKLKIKSVTQPTGAQPISVSDAESSAEFTIRK